MSCPRDHFERMSAPQVNVHQVKKTARKGKGRAQGRLLAELRSTVRRCALASLLGALIAIALINGLLRWVSGTPGPHLLDPRYLGPKARALAAYARHRPACLVFGEKSAYQCVPEAAGKSHLEPELLEALLRVESGGRAHCISERGACGPLQLMPSTARRLQVSDPFDPRAATLGGARYLREQLDRFHGDKALALAAYNAGPGAVHGVVPHNGETELYVPRVLAQYRVLRLQRTRALRREAASKKPAHR